MADDDPGTIRREFGEAVNMTPAELEQWLDSDASRAVGQKDGGGESTGHASGRRILPRSLSQPLQLRGPEGFLQLAEG